MHEVPGVTEFRPGTYVYNDRTTAEIGACGWDDCALDGARDGREHARFLARP